MKQNKKYIQLFLFVILVFMILVPFALGESNVNQITFLNNKLSVNIENVSLGSVLSTIHKKTGIKFLLDEKDGEWKAGKEGA